MERTIAIPAVVFSSVIYATDEYCIFVADNAADLHRCYVRWIFSTKSARRLTTSNSNHFCIADPSTRDFLLIYRTHLYVWNYAGVLTKYVPNFNGLEIIAAVRTTHGILIFIESGGIYLWHSANRSKFTLVEIFPHEFVKVAYPEELFDNIFYVVLRENTIWRCILIRGETGWEIQKEVVGNHFMHYIGTKFAPPRSAKWYIAHCGRNYFKICTADRAIFYYRDDKSGMWKSNITSHFMARRPGSSAPQFAGKYYFSYELSQNNMLPFDRLDALAQYYVEILFENVGYFHGKHDAKTKSDATATADTTAYYFAAAYADGTAAFYDLPHKYEHKLCIAPQANGSHFLVLSRRERKKIVMQILPRLSCGCFSPLHFCIKHEQQTLRDLYDTLQKCMFGGNFAGSGGKFAISTIVNDIIVSYL